MFHEPWGARGKSWQRLVGLGRAELDKEKGLLDGSEAELYLSLQV